MKTPTPWVRKDTDLDLHFDCEFIDGRDGFSFISIGAVLVSNRKTTTFYGIDSEFFETNEFQSYVDTNNTQTTWMFDNVFRHIEGMADVDGESKQGNLKELRDFMRHSDFNFVPNIDQKYVVMKDGKESDLEEPDVVVVGTQKKIASELLASMQANINGKDNLKAVRLFCYYGAYDQYALCRLWGGMLAAPEVFNTMNYDIRSIGDSFGYEHDDFNDETPHHALSDAVVQYGMMRRLRNRIVKEHGQRIGLSESEIKTTW